MSAQSVLDVESFLAESSQFRLGDLPTESPHPLTPRLSALVQEDVGAAIRVLTRVDRQALERVLPAALAIDRLRAQVRDTLASGGRVFLCGCGATGRLSMSLEVLWRQTAPAGMAQAVVAFMAGGDLALVHSIENFEDHPEFGARQLRELGFSEDDLLIASTEGGETPFVIGATEEASRVSRRRPWFLYCNPDDVLARVAARSRRVLENSAIERMNLSVGPMAISGSTRMQASTVLMLAAGLALLDIRDDASARERLERFLVRHEKLDVAFLEPFVSAEAGLYRRGDFVLYEADRHGITILTDTTERAPTFSLRPFENSQDSEAVPSLCYFHLPGATLSSDAWRALLCREPRPLAWPDVVRVAGKDRLLGFDFSDTGAHARSERVARLEGCVQERFRVRAATLEEGPSAGKALEFELASLRAVVPCAGTSILEEHLLLKMAMNIHSTLVMGLGGRYEGNLMTFVRPSNKKLIDRAVRYIRILRPGFSYERVARELFAEMATCAADEPIVLRTAQRLSNLSAEGLSSADDHRVRSATE